MSGQSAVQELHPEDGHWQAGAWWFFAEWEEEEEGEGGKDQDGYIVRDVTRSRRRQSPVQESLQWRNRGGGELRKII